MRQITKHYLIPHEHNNFRCKLLHHSSLILLVLILFISSVSLNYLQVVRPDVLGISYSISQQELLDHTNRVRQEHGLAPLQLNDSLVNAANGKAHHMMANNYWAHFAPDGTSPWKFIRDSGYGYIFAGENLAKGFTDPKSVVDAWMNSPSHRDNMLSDKYRDIGFAVVEGTLEGTETVLVVQMFGALDVPVQNEPVVAVSSDSLAPTPEKAETILPTAAPTVVATSPAIVTDVEVETQELATVPKPTIFITPSFLNLSAENFPKINLSSATRVIPAIVVGTLFLALILDFVIIRRKNIPRIVGHNIDHIMILGMFLLLLLLQRFGSIL